MEGRGSERRGRPSPPPPVLKRYDSKRVKGWGSAKDMIPWELADPSSGQRILRPCLDKVPDRIGAGRTSTGQVRERVTLAADDHITCYHESTVLVKINLRGISKLLAGWGVGGGRGKKKIQREKSKKDGAR